MERESLLFCEIATVACGRPLERVRRELGLVGRRWQMYGGEYQRWRFDYQWQGGDGRARMEETGLKVMVDGIGGDWSEGVEGDVRV
ncbi:hypothetical protein E3N88_34887 [Mikania micrantha]|uniref:Uncharacterized protein n=1 Tax=Mikania micrantha TaxID=192012 RepID=A0A5N6LZE9_9ASTR|nr:hypothetical protein E3N88_34887 [Mikania micrantha]